MIASQKNLIRLFLFALIFMLLVPASRLDAQPLDSLVAEALRNHPLLRAAEARAVSAEYRGEAVSQLPMPTLSLEFTQTPAGNFDVLNRSISNNLALSQMFMLGDKLAAMRRAEREGAQTEHERRAEAAAIIRGNVSELYARLWRLDRQKEVLGRTTIMLSNLVQSAEDRLAAGKATMNEVLLLRAELAAEQAKFHSSNFERRGKAARLNTFLGRTNLEAEILTIADSNFAKTIEALLGRTYQARTKFGEQNPTLRRMASMERMTEAERIAAEQERTPDLMLQGMLMRMPQGMILTSGSSALSEIFSVHTGLSASNRVEWMYSLMASITLPFAPWSSARIDAKQAELNARQLSQKAEREAMQRELAGELAEAEQMLLHTIETVKDYNRTILPAYKQALNGLLLSFQTNQSSISDILRTAQMLAMKEDELAMAHEEQMMLVAKLRMMLGDGE
ncbi:MAG: TolC family protein [Candidatus Kapabacteria bacterium]|nr:TolC family protein [Candidatus Kapabacteria bacterium]